MAQNVDQKPENHLARPSGQLYSTAPADDIPDARPSAENAAPGTDDLPDIIDVVLEMGRAPEEPQAKAQAPSPSLPAASTPRLPGHLAALADRGAWLCRGGEFRQYASRLCIRLEAFFELVLPARG